MAKSEKENEQEVMDITIEEAFAQVDEKIKLLEKDDVTLEDSFRFFQEGMDLLKYCGESIDKVEKKVQKIMADGETEDFE